MCGDDMQVTDDRVFHRGLFRIANHIFGEENFKSVPEIGTRDRAEQSG